MYLYLFTSTAWKFICTVCSTTNVKVHLKTHSGNVNICLSTFAMYIWWPHVILAGFEVAQN